MTRKLVVGAGWKMNKTVRQAQTYCAQLLPLVDPGDVALTEIFVLPPFTALAQVAAELEGSGIRFGAQNMHWEPSGAWTGEISPEMLRELGCSYVEIGHSERRQFFNETDATVNRKVLAALAHHLTPILCIGEPSLGDVAQNQVFLWTQLEAALAHVKGPQLSHLLIAYEPQWAIGQAHAASPEYVQTVHHNLRERLAAQFGDEYANAMRLLYGGSVNLENAAAIARQSDVDGLFIGRAALDPANFAQFIRLVAATSVAKAQLFFYAETE